MAVFSEAGSPTFHGKYGREESFKGAECGGRADGEGLLLVAGEAYVASEEV